MPLSSKRISGILLILLSLGLILAYFNFRPSPFSRFPITYRIRMVDGRFGLTKQEFRAAVIRAAGLWGEPLSRVLFQEDPQGAVEINLSYDYRQEATDHLKKLNYKLDGSKTSYDQLSRDLAGLKAEFEQKNEALKRDSQSYQARTNTFNAEAEQWNRRGAVTENTLRRLTQEKEELDALREDLKGRQEDLKNLAYTINNMVVAINEIAAAHNLDVAEHQNTKNSLGREFCEGLYESKNGRQTITIYQFDSHERLVRVLAHEFGHALGLPHSPVEESVMYRIIKSTALQISPDDLAALKKHLSI
jgi:hypothetical protein